MTHILRAAIIDHQPLFRHGVISAMQSSGLCEVIAEGSTARDAITIARDFAPDIMILDLDVPGPGLEAIQHIALTCAAVRMVILINSVGEAAVTACLAAGVSGYLRKRASSEELLQVVRSVSEGEAYISRGLAACLLTRGRDRSTKASSIPAPLLDLTPCEMKILGLMAEGHTNKVISRRVLLSDKVVKQQVSSILQKLQVRSRLEAGLRYWKHCQS